MGCWNLNLPSQSVSKGEIQQRQSHLRDVPIDITDKNVSILIPAGILHLHIFHNVNSDDQNEPIAMLTKLGWVLLGGNGNKSKVLLNHIRSDQNLIQQKGFRTLKVMGQYKKEMLNYYQKGQSCHRHPRDNHQWVCYEM